MGLRELMQKRDGIHSEHKALVARAVSEGRGLTEEEKIKASNLQKGLDALNETIEAALEIQARDVALDKPTDQILRPSGDGQIVVGRDRAEDAPWKNGREFLLAVFNAGQPGATPDPRLKFQAAAGLSATSPSDGGFLVGKQMEKELLKETYQNAVIAPLCRKIPIEPGFDGLEVNAVDESSRADGSRWGGIVVYRKAEAEEATASKPKFRKMSIDLEDMIGLCYATNRLIKNSAALESIIREGFAEEFAFKLDDEIINGNGAGQCLGVLSSPALVTVAKESGQAVDTIIAENITKMWSRMWARCRPKAIWLINQDCEPQLHTMSLSVGTGGVPVYMPAGGLSASPYATLYGRPVIPIEQCQTVGDKGDIILVDPSEYVLIDQEMEEASSIHVRFLYGENTFRFAYPVNGQPKWNGPKAPKNGSNTLSPFVALAARA